MRRNNNDSVALSSNCASRHVDLATKRSYGKYIGKMYSQNFVELWKSHIDILLLLKKGKDVFTDFSLLLFKIKHKSSKKPQKILLDIKNRTALERKR